MNRDDAPSAWRLFWSPKAIAWWACYRPIASLRIGTAALGIWWGGFFAWALASLHDPFGEPASRTFGFGVSAWIIVFLSIHVWTWYPFRERQLPFGGSGFACALLASTPATMIDAPDALLSIYRDAAYYATFDPTLPVWPELPPFLEALTQTCAWVVLAFVVWAIYLVTSLRRLRQLPSPSQTSDCVSCGYNLTGTRAAGIERCPECGTAVETFEVEGDTNNTEK